MNTPQLPRVLPNEIRGFVDEELRRAGRPLDCANKVYVATELLLRYWLGDEWVDKNANETKPHAFLANRPGELGSWHFEVRFLELAELLFNLQDVVGFQHRLRTLQTEPEVAIPELQTAQLLLASAIPFEFVEPRPGRTYDAEILIEGIRAPCEMKSKIEGTEPSWTSIKNRLDYARKNQLPQGVANVVMLRVPGSWMEGDSNRQETLKGISDVFRRSTRIAVVVVHWEQLRLFEAGLHRALVCHAYHNARAPDPLIAVSRSLNQRPPAQRAWSTLHSILCGPDEPGPGQWPPPAFDLQGGG